MDLTIEIAQEAGEIVIRANLAEYDSWPAAFRKPGAAS